MNILKLGNRGGIFMNKLIQRKDSLITKIVVLVIGILLMINGTTSFIIYRQIKQETKEQIEAQIQGLLYGIRANINGDKLQQLISKNGEDIKVYTEMNEYLNKFLDHAQFKYMYTIGKLKDGSFYYLVDSLKKADKDYVPFGTPLELNEDGTYKLQEQILEEGIGFSKIQYFEEWGYLITGYVTIENSKGEPIALLGIDYTATDYKKQLNALSNKVWLTSFGATLCVGIVLTFYLLKALKPLKTIKNAIIMLADGYLDIRLENKGKDEIGLISEAFNQMASELKHMIEVIKQNTDQLNIHSKDLLDKSKGMHQSSALISNNALEIRDTTQISKEHIETIREKMQQVENKMSSIESKIEKVVNCSSQAWHNAEIGEKEIKKNFQQVYEVNTRAEEAKIQLMKLQNKMEEMNNFITLITQIAGQTRILSLNASIQAAYTKEGGTSFKVVAEEVRKLAEQSNTAAIEATRILENITIETSRTVSMMDTSFEQIQETTHTTEEIVRHFNEIVGSSKEITENMDAIKENISIYALENKYILKAIQTADKNTISLLSNGQNISAITQEQFSNAEELLKWAEDLDGISEKIKEEILFFK